MLQQISDFSFNDFIFGWILSANIVYVENIMHLAYIFYMEAGDKKCNAIEEEGVHTIRTLYVDNGAVEFHITFLSDVWYLMWDAGIKLYEYYIWWNMSSFIVMEKG